MKTKLALTVFFVGLAALVLAGVSTQEPAKKIPTLFGGIVFFLGCLIVVKWVAWLRR
jgi:hypothetical protein